MLEIKYDFVEVVKTCEDDLDCCDCGGADCECRYCWSCNACDECLAGEGETCHNAKKEMKQTIRNWTVVDAIGNTHKIQFKTKKQLMDAVIKESEKDYVASVTLDMDAMTFVVNRKEEVSNG